MQDMVKIAAVQMEPEIMRKRENLEKISLQIKRAAQNGAQLIVFPECALTGYVYNSREEAMPYMESVPGPATAEIVACCRQHGVYVIAGLLEIEGERCFNTAILAGPSGLLGKYRKNHLPFLGIDRFLDPGDNAITVFKTEICNIGIQICYDCNFPEGARVQMLLGADILALPTNWPEGRGKVPRYIVAARAYENSLHVVAADRTGMERGTKFIGQSRIVSARGDILAEAGSENEEIIYAEVSPSEAREKHIVFKKGEFEIDLLRDRRPELYSELTKPRAG